MRVVLIAAVTGILGAAASPAAEALRTPEAIRPAVIGCWDRLPGPWQAEAQANGGVAEETVCFRRNGEATIDILGGGGNGKLADGSEILLDMEGWGEQGRFWLSADRLLVSGMAWEGAEQLSCQVESTGKKELHFFGCIAREGEQLNSAAEAYFQTQPAVGHP